MQPPGPGRCRAHDVRAAPRAGGRERRQLTRLEARPGQRPALEAWVRDHGTLEEAAASHPDAETLTGRGRVYSVPAPDGDGRWVVRHYHRGGAIAPILGDRYLRLGTPRPVRELRLGWELEERGVPTPVHIGAAVYPSGIWYRGDLVTRHVPDARDLAAVLFPGRSLAGSTDPGTPEDDRVGAASGPDRGPGAEESPGTDGGAGSAVGSSAGSAPAPSAAMRAAGRLFHRLHGAGVVHPDLNLKNILIQGVGDDVAALVLDLDGAALRDRVGARARGRMIARFWRSARKWERATGVELAPSLEDAFGAGYEG